MRGGLLSVSTAHIDEPPAVRDRSRAIIGTETKRMRPPRYARRVIATSRRNRMRRQRIGAILLLVQGIAMEASVFVGVAVLLVMRVPQSTITDRVEIFALPYLNENLYLAMAISGVFATLRIIGAVGVLRNQLWALVLSLINCAVTLVLMIFMLPAGLLDGALTGAALVLLLSAWIDPARTIITTDRDAGTDQPASASARISARPR